jgi:hypothetical protein
VILIEKNAASSFTGVKTVDARNCCRLAFSSAAIFLVALTSPLRGQPDDAATAAQDEKYLKLLDEERAKGAAGAGLIMIGVAVKGTCRRVIIAVTRRVDGKPETQQIGTRGGDPHFRALTRVPAGDHVVAAVACQAGRDRFQFNGPFARFKISAGEFVNLGTLQLVYKMKSGFFDTEGESHRSIVAADPAALARAKKAAPRLAARMITRPMTLIGPESVNVKRKSPFN